MAIMTKATTITWASEIAQYSNTSLNEERNTKLAEMLAAGKTEGNPNIIAPNVTIREWLDQAAAEEYRDFILGLDEKYGPGLVLGITIEDAN
jgi:hypothetical protein